MNANSLKIFYNKKKAYIIKFQIIITYTDAYWTYTISLNKTFKIK